MAEIKYVDWDGLVYYDSKSKQYIDDKFEGCLKMGGIIPFSNLPSPSFQNLNYVYKITEEFTSNEFFEKQGYTYRAGTWVQVIDIDNVYLYTIFNEEDVVPILPGGELDLSNYYTISQTDDAISTAVASIERELTDYATQQWVEDKGYLTDIPDEYTTVDFVVDAIDKAKPDLTPYATTTYVNEAIRSEIDAIPEPDLSSYALKSEIPTVNEFINSIPKEYVTESELDDKGYITDISGKADVAHKHSISDIEGFDLDIYAKTSDIEDFITMQDVEDKNYATVSEVSGKADKTHTHSIEDIDGYESPDLTPYALKSDLEGVASESYVNAAVDKIETDLDNYYNKSEVDQKIADAVTGGTVNLDNYYTKSETDALVADAIDDIELPDMSEYAKLTDIPDVSKFITEIPDSYATKSYVNDTITDNLTGYAKTSEIPTVDAFINAIPDKYVTDTELSAMNYATNTVVNEKADKNHKHSYNDLSDLPTIPSIEGLATESFVEESVESAIESTVSNYYTKAEVDTAIDESISSIEIPEVDTDSFATKVELSAKSDAVLFTTDLFVNDPVGDFVIGDSVKGLTIKQILTRILALSPTVNPDTPDVPTTESLVETIIEDKIPMYQLDIDGNIIEGSNYSYKEMTPEQASLAPTEECFYQIKDSSGEVIESGYQHLSAPTDDMFYLVLLPVGVTFGADGNTTHQVWDEGQQIWTTSNLELISDKDAIKAVLDENELPFPVYNESEYTLWADSTFESWAGADYRFIINEDK